VLICYIRIPLVSQWFVICNYSLFSQWFAVVLYSHSVGFRIHSLFASIPFSQWSQSCYMRILLVSHWFFICIYSFFAMIRSHVIFAFRWFRIDSLFVSIRFSRLFAVMLYSHSVGFVVIRYLRLFVFHNESHSCYIRIPLVSDWFVIRIYSFFAIIRSHVILAFRWSRCDSLLTSIRFSQWFAVMLYSHSVGFAFIRYSHLFVFRNDSQSCYIRNPLVSQWFVICIYSFFAMILSHSINMLYSHSVGFAVIRSSHLFVFRNDSQSCYIRIPLLFALIRYSHLFVFRDYSQSCYVRIPFVSLWFVICIYSFFTMSRTHIIFAFRWFRIDSLFASIRFSQWFAVMLYLNFEFEFINKI
jgi:hypothetical protein